jgi:hypothetical protein
MAAEVKKGMYSGMKKGMKKGMYKGDDMDHNGEKMCTHCKKPASKCTC